MKHKHEPSGFITLIVALLGVLIFAIVLAYLKVSRTSS
jgi:hypothetical protein